MKLVIFSADAMVNEDQGSTLGIKCSMIFSLSRAAVPA
jgi:hypothetical protein